MLLAAKSSHVCHNMLYAQDRVWPSAVSAFGLQSKTFWDLDAFLGWIVCLSFIFELFFFVIRFYFQGERWNQPTELYNISQSCYYRYTWLENSKFSWNLGLFPMSTHLGSQSLNTFSCLTDLSLINFVPTGVIAPPWLSQIPHIFQTCQNRWPLKWCLYLISACSLWPTFFNWFQPLVITRTSPLYW